MLLVFFVMTTHFVENPGLAVELPSAGAPPSYTKPDGIEVTVDAEGHYYVNQKPVADTTPATLREALMAAAGERRRAYRAARRRALHPPVGGDGDGRGRCLGWSARRRAA